jgi:hypothetical protein
MDVQIVDHPGTTAPDWLKAVKVPGEFSGIVAYVNTQAAGPVNFILPPSMLSKIKRDQIEAAIREQYPELGSVGQVPNVPKKKGRRRKPAGPTIITEV